MAEPYKHIYKVDLDQPLKRFDVGDILASGDEKANRFEVTVCRDGANVDLSGCVVLGYFIRPNDETMTVDGTANGSKAIVEPSKNCYVYDGEFSLAIKLVGSGITQTVAVFDGRIVRTTSENIVDGDRVIYGLEDLLAQIAATEAAAKNANTAAGKANTATQNANTATSNANSATSAANSAADRANAAANNWANGIVANASKLGGKAPEYYLRPHNLLVNSYWRNPVNQRGITGPTESAGYHLDRWVNTYVRPKVTVNAGYVTLTNDSSTGYRVFQRLTAGTLVAGTKYTAAIKLHNGGVYCAAITAASGDQYSSQFENMFRFCITKGDTYDSFSISITAEKTLDVEWVALYEGDYTADLPPYMPKGYAAELLECQRYFISFPTYSSYAVPFAHGNATSETTARVELTLPVPMRIETPSVTADGVTWYLRSVGTSSTATVAVLRAIGNKLILTATVASGLTNYQQATLSYYGQSGKTLYICFSAEIGEEG